MKKTFPVLVGLVVGLVAGAIFGHFIAPPVGVRVSGNTATEAEVRNRDDQTPPANNPKPAADKCSPQPEPKPDGTSAKNPTSLKEIIDGITVELPARGSGTITGKVSLANGSPVVGVAIEANENIPYESPEDSSIEEEVRSMIRRRKLAANAKRSAKTGTDGSYVIEGVGSNNYWMSATLAGYKVAPMKIESIYKAKAGETIDFIASPIFTLTVEILLPTVGQPNEASVNYQKTAGDGRMYGSGYTWTSAKPTLELDPGTYSFTAKAGEFDEYVAQAVSVEIGAGQATHVTLKLESKPAIVGKITLPPDMVEDDNIRVHALKYEGSQVPSTTAIISSRTQTWPNEHDNWTYKFADVAPGNYVVAVLREGQIAASATVVVSQGVVRADLVMAGRNRADYVVVHVLAPDGSAVEGVSISAGYRSDSGSGTRGSRSRREKDGSYWVAHNESNREESGRGAISYFVIVESAKYGKKEEVYEKTATSEVTVQFMTPAFVTITIVGYDTFEGRDRLDLQIRKGSERVSISDYERPNGERKTGATRKLGPVEPGTYEIVLLLRDGEREYQASTLAVEGANLRAGEQEATISVPALFTVRVLLKEAKADRRVEMTSEKRGAVRRTANTDDQGAATFKDLPAGTYDIRVDRKRMTVVISASTDVNFEPVETNAIRVEIKNANGYAATLGLQTGDLIVAANGTKFTSEAQMSGLLEGLLEEKAVKLTVARGSSEFEVEADMQKLFKNRDAEMKPATR